MIFYKKKKKKWDYDRSFEYVQKIRSCINPNSYFVEQLKEYYDKYIKYSIFNRIKLLKISI